MYFRVIQALLLFTNILALPILVPQPSKNSLNTNDQTQIFQPLALVIQDPLQPQQFRSLSLDPSRNHAQTLEQQNHIIDLGENLSLDITKTLLSPLVSLNNRISSAAAQLPAYLATNGAMIGSAIATPIHFGTLAANNIAAGVTGTLVAVPISFGSGITAQVVGVVQSGQEVVLHKSSEIQNFINQNAQQLVPALSAIKGVHSVVHGAAMKTLGLASQQIGSGLHTVGSIISDAGISAHQFGLDASSYGLEPSSHEITHVSEPEVVEQIQSKNSGINEDHQVIYEIVTNEPSSTESSILIQKIQIQEPTEAIPTSSPMTPQEPSISSIIVLEPVDDPHEADIVLEAEHPKDVENVTSVVEPVEVLKPNEQIELKAEAKLDEPQQSEFVEPSPSADASSHFPDPAPPESTQ